ncbi:MAG: tryptophan synthase subunit alpha [Nitrosopumilus sp. H13]|nr:MAG: tryptophan synthase subunit alpha [Nitrosopumilus sp. H13]
MPRISAKFAELRKSRQSALVAYVMAGFPSNKATRAAVSGMVRGGADIIELGFPFSDPLADGPVIQNASRYSLQKGENTRRFFEMVRKIRRETDIPLVLMTYSNILHRMGYSRFISEAADAGIDGFILPDMPVEEAAEYKRAARGRAETIFLTSPNTSKSRIKSIAGASGGFLYLVAVYGTTGAKTGIKEYTIRAIKDVKRQTSMPVGVGFGVSAPADVRRYVRAGADAVIVGSAYMRIIEETPHERIESRIASFTRRLKKETIHAGSS